MKCLQFNLWLEFFGIFSLIRTSKLIICQTRSSWASWNGKSWVESLTFLERNWQHQSFQHYLPLGPQCHLLRDQFQCRGHRHQISTSTNNQNMQRSNLIVINVSAKQHKKAIWSCTNYWYIRGQNLIVIIVTTNSKNNQSLNNHKQLKHKGITYDCNQCEYKATTMGSLKVLKQSQHERFEYICVEFEYGAKQALNIYKQSKHEASFVDYKRDYKATTKVQLRVHKLSKHMGIKYNLI